MTRTADPADADVTIYADPAGSGTDSDPYDPVGGGTDSDVTIPADPRTRTSPAAPTRRATATFLDQLTPKGTRT